MNQRIKRKWLEALRSGEYVQGRDRLLTPSADGDSFCCLGVLCELHAQETGGVWTGQTYMHNRGALPRPVALWAGLDARDPIVSDMKLSSHNDGTGLLQHKPKSFRRIADLIEKHL